ncbi:hypothetical protein [Ferruginibacter sp.]
MGYDISYHPISEAEINDWYFDILNNEGKIDKFATDFEIDLQNKEQYKLVIKIAKEVPVTDLFDTKHGYYIAVTQGFFRKYFFTRGSSFSFLIDEIPGFNSYTKKWQDIVHFEIKNPLNNKLTSNYSAGVYLPLNKIIELLNDYKTNIEIKTQLDNWFSFGRIAVFLKALNFCIEAKTGLLEASEVVEINPFDLQNSASYSNLGNCDLDGPFLYREAALDQLKAAYNNPK